MDNIESGTPLPTDTTIVNKKWNVAFLECEGYAQVIALEEGVTPETINISDPYDMLLMWRLHPSDHRPVGFFYTDLPDILKGYYEKLVAREKIEPRQWQETTYAPCGCGMTWARDNTKSTKFKYCDQHA